MRVFITRDEYKISTLSKKKRNINQNKIFNHFNYNKRNLRNIKNIKPRNLLNIENIKPVSFKNNKKALYIGITYENTKFQLNGCINDVLLMKNILEKRGFTSILLTEKSEIKPTKQNIILQLENFLSSSQDGDILYIHYSGHGSNVLDYNNDENDGRDETIVTSDFNHITDDEFHNIIKTKLTTKSKLFAVFDSCHSGSVLDLKYIFNNSNLEKVKEEEDLKPSVVLISGCKDDQYSQEVTTMYGSHGLLTQTLYTNISQINNISWLQLYTNIKGMLNKMGASQIPQLSCSSIINLNEKIEI